MKNSGLFVVLLAASVIIIAAVSQYSIKNISIARQDFSSMSAEYDQLVVEKESIESELNEAQKSLESLKDENRKLQDSIDKQTKQASTTTTQSTSTYSAKERQIYNKAIEAYNELYSRLKSPDSLRIYGVKYNESRDMVIFWYGATNSFGAEITDYAAYDGSLDTNWGQVYYDSSSAKSISWDAIVKYSQGK